ncbi:MAG: DUF1805 domain-containing protein [Candidatus Omnitrophota bacterium]|nr:MAG: DUF1805 domain-containing protein [Candidatus Omnitrophota bacterium]
MLKSKKVKVGNKYIHAFLIKLLSKNLIVLKGSKGYICCGYLNLSAAEKFKDAAVKIVKVSTIEEALKAKVWAVSSAARKLGIYKGQPVRDVLKIII